jgi:hypothetical protein
MSEQLSLIDFINQVDPQALEESVGKIEEKLIKSFDQNSYSSRKKGYQLAKEILIIKSQIKKIKKLHLKLKKENKFKKSSDQLKVSTSNQDELTLLKEALETNAQDNFKKQLAYRDLSVNYEKLRAENESLKKALRQKEEQIKEYQSIIESKDQDNNVKQKTNLQKEDHLNNEVQKYQDYLKLFSEKILDLTANLKKNNHLLEEENQLNIKDHLPIEQQEVLFVLVRELQNYLSRYIDLENQNNNLLITTLNGLKQLKDSMKNEKLLFVEG